MNYAIQIEKTGGPEQMHRVETETREPVSGEVLIRHTAIGLNFIDTYHRSGLYTIELPAVLGQEASGVIEAVGKNVQNFQVGERVVYATGPMGSYCMKRCYPAEKLVKLPDGISDKQAATVMLKGMTAEYLLNRTAQLKPGDTILLHAAAGGAGLLVLQWAKHLGCTVIGTVGDAKKAELVKSFGCDHVILYRTEDVARGVMDITNGVGVPVVYDSVGQSTFQGSLDSLSPRGLFVSWGQASGPIPDLNLRVFAPKCLYFTRPSLFAYTSTRKELENCAKALFEMLSGGHIKSEVRQTYPLGDAEQAHRDLETRKTVGATLLLP